MSDETPVPETLETIAASIRELRQSMESRFDAVDARFEKVDARFDAVDARFEKVDARFGAVDARLDRVESRITTELAETKSQLGTKIEAVHAEVRLVYDEVIAQRAKHKANDEEHDRFRGRLADHNLRLLALTRRKSGRGK